MLKDWRKLNIGDTVRWYGSAFDGGWDETGTVIRVFDDHAIIACNGMNLWLDDEFAYQFERLGK